MGRGGSCLSGSSDWVEPNILPAKGLSYSAENSYIPNAKSALPRNTKDNLKAHLPPRPERCGNERLNFRKSMTPECVRLDDT